MIDPGLCRRCRHARRIHSDRGSSFLLCARSRTDRGYPKYPRLPVLECPGFEPRPPAAPTIAGGGDGAGRADRGLAPSGEDDARGTDPSQDGGG